MLSDHFLLVLTTSKISWGSSFIAVFKKEWIQLSQLSFEQKIKAMKKPLKKWNREVFGLIDIKIKSLQDELSKLDVREQSQMPQDIDKHRRNLCNHRCGSRCQEKRGTGSRCLDVKSSRKVIETLDIST